MTDRDPVSEMSQAFRLSRLRLLIFALALAWQTLSVQTHIHDSCGSDGGAAACSSLACTFATPTHQGQDDPANCPLCREQAQAGHTLSSGAAAFPPPIPSEAPIHASSIALWSHGGRSHAWLGRAPPRHA